MVTQEMTAPAMNQVKRHLIWYDENIPGPNHALSIIASASPLNPARLDQSSSTSPTHTSLQTFYCLCFDDENFPIYSRRGE